MRTLFVFLCLSALACQPTTTNTNNSTTTTEAKILSPANDSLYTLVVKIHDDIMPENATISSLQQQLKKVLPTLKQDKKDRLLPILADLQIAYDGMMDWMRQFKNTEFNADEYKLWSPQQTRDYLLDQQLKIQKVDSDMRKSIANAKAWQAANPQ
jgi:biopolymer transport protein ExbD